MKPEEIRVMLAGMAGQLNEVAAGLEKMADTLAAAQAKVAAARRLLADDGASGAVYGRWTRPEDLPGAERVDGNQVYRLPGVVDNDVVDPATGVVTGQRATMRVGKAVRNVGDTTHSSVSEIHVPPQPVTVAINVSRMPEIDHDYLAKMAAKTLERLYYGVGYPEAPARESGNDMSNGAQLGGG